MPSGAFGYKIELTNVVIRTRIHVSNIFSILINAMSVLIVMAAIKKMQKPKRIVSLLNRIIIKIKKRFKKHNISRNVSKPAI